jgi:site-specific DNA-methyltransferase (adenine-specific)
LKDEGTCWVNIGDTYGTKSGSGFANDNLNPQSPKEIAEKTGIYEANKIRGTSPEMHKNLCNIPARFSIEMQNRGWCLRNVIIWHKPNCMPSSIKDRFTVDFEYLFFFVKNKKYWFETQYEPHNPKYASDWDKKNERKGVNYNMDTKNRMTEGRTRSEFYGENGRNKRTVWKITTKPFRECHFATYPEELCETPIKAGCPVGGITLDPFFGAGTTGLVALKQNKRFVGIELNPEYIKIAENRLKPHIEQKKLI